MDRDPAARRAGRSHRHKADPAGPPVIARHAGCGKDLRVTLRCAAGHEVAGPEDIELVDGPGLLPLAPA